MKPPPSSSMASVYMISLILLLIASVTHGVRDLGQQTLTDSSSSTHKRLNNMIETLMATKDFTHWGELLSDLSKTDPYFNFPVSATLFIPDDNPFFTNTTSSISSSTIRYHIIPEKLPFSKLENLHVGSKINTLLPSKSITVTDNSKYNYMINGIQITHPDLIMNQVVVVHGIKSHLDYSAVFEDDLCQSLTEGYPFYFLDRDIISKEQQMVVKALLSARNYTNWVKLLCLTHPSDFQRNLTFLVSTDNPLWDNQMKRYKSQYHLDYIIAYNTIPSYLPFSALLKLDIGSNISTYVSEKPLVVTNTSYSNFTINGVLITHPDLFTNGAIAVHGIESTLTIKDLTFVERANIFVYDNEMGITWVLIIFVMLFMWWRSTIIERARRQAHAHPD
ncbi:fasciclin-like arabinogalactan protein 21 [Papaver somniferum]|uniref:fasciclin-like arabinogalactan protein 21 n=1 Tax=Papaver somniferum TaxID=3469 RepID=UPI000E6FAD75|nr:fasciclin-like arabinogalactan protein 21 [Papaver somniferum]